MGGTSMNYGDKFEVTGDTKEVDGHLVWQIRATKDFSAGIGRGYRVLKHDLGGWLEFPGHDHESQWGHHGYGLRQLDASWVNQDAVVLDQAMVSENARVYNHAVVRDRAVVDGYAHVSGRDTVIRGSARVGGEAYVHSYRGDGPIVVEDYVTIGDHAVVEGGATISGYACLRGYVNVTEGARIKDSTLYSGSIRRDARITRRSEIIVVEGFLPEGTLTVYRAANEANHVVTAGCQTFTLDLSTKELTELAAEHGWQLPVGWRSLRNGLLAVVRTWNPVPEEKEGTTEDTTVPAEDETEDETLVPVPQAV